MATNRQLDGKRYAVNMVMMNAMGPLIFALYLMFAVGGLSAQTPAWQPSAGHTQVPIWPGAGPDTQPLAGAERSTTTGKDDLVAGKPYLYVERVSRPAMT